MPADSYWSPLDLTRAFEDAMIAAQRGRSAPDTVARREARGAVDALIAVGYDGLDLPLSRKRAALAAASRPTPQPHDHATHYNVQPGPYEGDGEEIWEQVDVERSVLDHWGELVEQERRASPIQRQVVHGGQAALAALAGVLGLAVGAEDAQRIAATYAAAEEVEFDEKAWLANAEALRARQRELAAELAAEYDAGQPAPTLGALLHRLKPLGMGRAEVAELLRALGRADVVTAYGLDTWYYPAEMRAAFDAYTL